MDEYQSLNHSKWDCKYHDERPFSAPCLGLGLVRSGLQRHYLVRIRRKVYTPDFAAATDGSNRLPIEANRQPGGIANQHPSILRTGHSLRFARLQDAAKHKLAIG